jgi:hypothetical protein
MGFGAVEESTILYNFIDRIGKNGKKETVEKPIPNKYEFRLLIVRHIKRDGSKALNL